MSLTAEDREGMAYHDGYQEGKADGYSIGHAKGYKAGYEQALTDQRKVRNGWAWVLRLSR